MLDLNSALRDASHFSAKKYIEQLQRPASFHRRAPRLRHYNDGVIGVRKLDKIVVAICRVRFFGKSNCLKTLVGMAGFEPDLNP